jgi:hypothetical protein
MKIKCTQNLFKSTYNKNAFIKNKQYEILLIDNNFYYIKDELSNEFTFSTTKKYPYHYIEDYFEL